jgi:hypothetical protein
VAKRGRPSKYKKEFCDELIAHMAQGLSFESFAAKVDANPDTLFTWAKRHREFSEAKKKGTARSLLFWETMGRNGAAGKIKGFVPAPWIFNMKNRFGWRDRQEDDSAAQQTTPEVRDALAVLDHEEKNARGATPQHRVPLDAAPAAGHTDGTATEPEPEK